VDAQTDGDGVADGAVRQRLQGCTPFSPGIHELTLAIVNPSPCAGGAEPAAACTARGKVKPVRSRRGVKGDVERCPAALGIRAPLG
jgi:hypothetical protein